MTDTTDSTDPNVGGVKPFDRFEDDSCHGCQFAVRKPDDKLRAPWVRPYGCVNLDIIKLSIKAAIRSLRDAQTYMSWDEWQPNKPTVEKLNSAARWSTDAADLLWDLFRYGYMEPETVCVFKRNKVESTEETPK